MKFIDFYKKNLNCKTPDAVFDCFLSTLKPSNTLWSYFVNWEKVFANTKKIEVSLNILNYLIGKEKNFDDEFRHLLKEHSKVIKAIPALVVRDGKSTKQFKI